jgi:hypothetical protein
MIGVGVPLALAWGGINLIGDEMARRREQARENEEDEPGRGFGAFIPRANRSSSPAAAAAASSSSSAAASSSALPNRQPLAALGDALGFTPEPAEPPARQLVEGRGRTPLPPTLQDRGSDDSDAPIPYSRRRADADRRYAGIRKLQARRERERERENQNRRNYGRPELSPAEFFAEQVARFRGAR